MNIDNNDSVSYKNADVQTTTGGEFALRMSQSGDIPGSPPAKTERVSGYASINVKDGIELNATPHNIASQGLQK